MDKVIGDLEALKGAKPISRKRYSAVLDFLDKHRFYLRKEDCDLINPLISYLEQALRRQDKSQVWIVRPAFIPNSDLDEALYYQKE